jgi:hypothetical protein
MKESTRWYLLLIVLAMAAIFALGYQVALVVGPEWTTKDLR